jgi:hypothetical protein
MKSITRIAVLNFWTRELNSGRETYKDECGEKDYTLMGEHAAEHFSVESEQGNSEIEQDIFQWTTELIF